MLIGAQMQGFTRGSCILDVLSSGVPLTAYSTRKVTARYRGKCMNVRRSSDSTSMDIGFFGTKLDTTTLLAFVGSGTGYVTKWYNQGLGGSALDANNPTPAAQPEIVVAGVLQTENGLPTIYFPGGTYMFLPTGVGPASGASFTANMVFARNSSSTTAQVMWCLGTHATNDCYLAVTGSTGTIQWNKFSSSSYGGGNTITTYVPPNLGVYTNIYTSGVGALGYLNGTTGVNVAVLHTNSTTYGAIGGLSTSATAVANDYGLISMSELIIPLLAMSTADRQLLEHNQESVYGITGI